MLKNYMVIGGDGFLGNAIAESLRKSGKRVIITSRKKQNINDSCIYLDLRENIFSWKIPKDVDAAFFCAGITSIEQCRINPIESRKVNVINTIILASELLKNGVSFIFPSSNLVFDGQNPAKKSDAPLSPCVEYGRQKAMVETRLSDLSPNVSIIRFTKILGSQTLLINNWINQIKNKKIINPFSDMVLAPIPIDFALKAMLEIAEKKKFGVWQVSAKEDITYEQLAIYIAQKSGTSQQYVKPVSVKDSELKFESVPKHTTLDTSGIEKELGLMPPDVWDTIDSLYRHRYWQ